MTTAADLVTLRNAAQRLQRALERLHAVCLAMDAEVQAVRPTEAQYQRAMAGARAAIAKAQVVRT